MMKFPILPTLAAIVVLTACATNTPTTLAPTSSSITPTAAEPRTLSVMTHDSFAASETVIKAFEQAHNLKLNILKSGDAGAAINKAILAKGNPLADVFYGVDSTFLSRAIEADIFEPYAVTGISVPAQFQFDTALPPRVTPVDYGDVCINYDKAYFEGKKLAVPQSLQDLIKPEYKSLLVVENPATSSPGLAFMLATIKQLGADQWQNYWKKLRANDVKVVDGWENAYNTEFSGSSGQGPRPLVVSYASSPPAEVIFAKEPPKQAPTASIVGDGTCYRQIEYVGILKGTKNIDLAQAFVEFMLSQQFQEDMPLQMFVFPVNPQAKWPDAFVSYTQIPANPASMKPEEIAANRDKWIQQWTETVLR